MSSYDTKLRKNFEVMLGNL